MLMEMPNENGSWEGKDMLRLSPMVFGRGDGEKRRGDAGGEPKIGDPSGEDAGGRTTSMDEDMDRASGGANVGMEDPRRCFESCGDKKFCVPILCFCREEQKTRYPDSLWHLYITPRIYITQGIRHFHTWLGMDIGATYALKTSSVSETVVSAWRPNGPAVRRRLKRMKEHRATCRTNGRSTPGGV